MELLSCPGTDRLLAVSDQIPNAVGNAKQADMPIHGRGSYQIVTMTVKTRREVIRAATKLRHETCPISGASEAETAKLS
jgi:hypothetical protein